MPQRAACGRDGEGADVVYGAVVGEGVPGFDAPEVEAEVPEVFASGGIITAFPWASIIVFGLPGALFPVTTPDVSGDGPFSGAMTVVSSCEGEAEVVLGEAKQEFEQLVAVLDRVSQNSQQERKRFADFIDQLSRLLEEYKNNSSVIAETVEPAPVTAASDATGNWSKKLNKKTGAVLMLLRGQAGGAQSLKRAYSLAKRELGLSRNSNSNQQLSGMLAHTKGRSRPKFVRDIVEGLGEAEQTSALEELSKLYQTTTGEAISPKGLLSEAAEYAEKHNKK